MDLQNLEKAIKNSRDKETCYPKDISNWSIKKPSLWQCAVTALVVQDFVWWELLYCSHNNHYWNKLLNWEIIDLTRDQFEKNIVICVDKIVDRDWILNKEAAIHAQTNKRYQILKSRVEKKIKMNES